MTDTDTQFSIRHLSTVSGVNAITLRAWERRYGLLKPGRTPKGHRYYTNDDVEKVRNILNWLDRGVAISKVRPLLDTGNTTNEQDRNDHRVANTHWQDAIQQSLDFVNRFQREKLEQQLNELFANYPLDTLANNYFFPLREASDRNAQLRFGGSAEKSFLDSELQSDLLTRIRHANSNNNGNRVLLLALDKNQHSVSALLLAMALLESGLRLHLILDACEWREIPYIIEQSQLSPQYAIHAVVCHSDSKPDVIQLEQELARAANHSHIPFFLHGEWLNVKPALKNIDGTVALGQSLRASVATINHSLET